MLNLISRGRDLSDGKHHRLRLNLRDKCRSESDLLHRFIAQLNLSQFTIEKVDIRGNPACATILFVEVPEDEIEGFGIAHLFKRKWAKAGIRIRVNLSVIQLDWLGLNFFIDYNFDNHRREGLGPEADSVDDQIHRMIETAFEGNSNFILSRVSHIDA